VLRSITHSFKMATASYGSFCLVLGLCAVLAACIDRAPPRSFTEFMEDRFAREGTLVRCNADRTATANDPECINARRAAAALAAQVDADQRESRDAQSEVRLLAARQRQAASQEAERLAVAAAQAEEQLAYEAYWEETAAEEPPVENGAGQTVGAAIDGGATIETGSVMPAPSLEPIALPASTTPPLTTISLPRGAKPRVFEPSEPTLEEIFVPEHLRKLD